MEFNINLQTLKLKVPLLMFCEIKIELHTRVAVG